MPDRVLEIGGHAAGYCGRLFVREGADVVRVQHDAAAPAWADAEAMTGFLHAGKRQIATTDRDLVARLAGRADVVIVEAQTATAAIELGVREWSAPLTVVITPFGMTGPKRDWRATAATILAMAGYTHLMGDADKAPLNLPGHYVEMQSGTLAFMAANACRFAGRNDLVDLGMLEVIMSLSQFTTVRWHCASQERTRHGNDFWFVVPSEMFACADGWIYVNIVPAFWDAFTVFIDRPELLVDPRFENNDLRMTNRDALHSIVAAAVCSVPKQELVERAQSCRVPMGVVLDFDEVLHDEHLEARNFWERLQIRSGTEVKAPGSPFLFDRQPRPALAPPLPASGERVW